MKIIKILTISFGFTLQILFASLVVVDQSGNGDYTTIQAAVNTKADTVYIKNGEYFEKVSIEHSSIIKLIGESREGVIINNPNDNSFYLSATYSNLTLENLTVENGRIGGNDNQNFVAFNVTIIKCVIKSDIRLSVDGGLTAKNSLFLNSTGSVIADAGTSRNNNNSGSVIIENCFFYNIRSNSSTLNGISLTNKAGTITNTVFYDMDRAIKGNSDLYVSYCAFDNVDQEAYDTNVLNSFSSPSDGASKIVDIENGDYRLQADSPLINMGSVVGTYNDKDGTRNDIGLYGGPNSWNKAPLITSLSISSNTIEQGTTVTITGSAKSN